MVSSQSNKKINNNNPKKFVECPQIWFKYFFNGSIQLAVMWHMSLPDLRCVQQHNQLDMFPGSTVIKAHDWLLGGKGRDMGQISAISGVSRSLYSKCLQWFVSSLRTSLVELPHRAEGSCREVIFICRSIKIKILISVALKEAATTSELCDNVWYDAHVQPLNVAHH